MKRWSEHDARARFSVMLNLCLGKGPQLILRRGEAKAVLVSCPDWEALQKRARPSLKALMLAEEPQIDLDLSERAGWPPRERVEFD